MTSDPHTPETLEATLSGCWVVLIDDPEEGDPSPWSVMADDIGEAVAKAVQDWRDSLADCYLPHEMPKPWVKKVYRRSWITEIEWSERSTKGLGTYDMSQLANPR